VQAVILLRAATLRESLKGEKIALRPLVLLGGIALAAGCGAIVHRLLGDEQSHASNAWLVTLLILMFAGLRRKLLGIKVQRRTMAPPPTVRPVEAIEDVTVRTETVE
jgi:hypothetical protein